MDEREDEGMTGRRPISKEELIRALEKTKELMKESLDHPSITPWVVSRQEYSKLKAICDGAKNEERLNIISQRLTKSMMEERKKHL